MDTFNAQWFLAWVALYVILTMAAELAPQWAPIIGILAVGLAMTFIVREVVDNRLQDGLNTLGATV